MAEFDYTWLAVTDPGASEQFFNATEALPPLQIQEFSVDFSIANAWWLSELCRLSYRDNNRQKNTTRQEILTQANFREIAFIDNKWNQCSVVESLDGQLAIFIFRGSDSINNWITNSRFMPVKWQGEGNVHSGFLECFKRVWTEELSDIVDASKTAGKFSIFTGHSLGGAIANLASALVKPDILYTFGSPRTGNTKFTSSIASRAFTIINNMDIVAKVPLNSMGFNHVGSIFHMDRTFQNGKWDRVLTNPKKLAGPPFFISDHAPANYSVNLEKRYYQTTFSNG